MDADEAALQVDVGSLQGLQFSRSQAHVNHHQRLASAVRSKVSERGAQLGAGHPRPRLAWYAPQAYGFEGVRREPPAVRSRIFDHQSPGGAQLVQHRRAEPPAPRLVHGREARLDGSLGQVVGHLGSTCLLQSEQRRHVADVAPLVLWSHADDSFQPVGCELPETPPHSSLLEKPREIERQLPALFLPQRHPVL